MPEVKTKDFKSQAPTVKNYENVSISPSLSNLRDLLTWKNTPLTLENIPFIDSSYFEDDRLLDTLRNKLPNFASESFLKRRAATLNLADRIVLFNPKIAWKLRQCASLVWYDRPDCSHDYKASKFNANFCDLPFCPICAHRRSVKFSMYLGRAVEIYATKHNYHMDFLTVTLKDTEHLPSFDYIRKCLRNLRRSQFFKKYGIEGGIHVLEVNIGTGSGFFHPHVHTLILHKKPFSYIRRGRRKGHVDIPISQALSDAWSKITKGKGKIVDIEKYRAGSKELFKYITKSTTEMSDQQLSEFIDWQKGHRFIIRFGVLHNNKELNEIIEEIKDTENEISGEPIKCEICGETDLITVYCHDRGQRGIYELDHIEPYQPP